MTDPRALHERLLHRIHRRYATVTQTYALGALQLPFTRVADPNRVLDEVAEEEDLLDRLNGVRTPADRLHLPYWAELWDSAMGIATVVASEPSASPLYVLDLGCGMGLAGCAAAATGNAVTFADREAPALLFARLNTVPWWPRVQTRLLDWQRDQIGQRYDLILGADILYERRQWDYLEPFWRAHLNEHGDVLLGEPGRQTGTDFPAWAEARGWTVARFTQNIPTCADPIRLFRLTRAANTKSTVG